MLSCHRQECAIALLDVWGDRQPDGGQTDFVGLAITWMTVFPDSLGSLFTLLDHPGVAVI